MLKSLLGSIKLILSTSCLVLIPLYATANNIHNDLKMMSDEELSATNGQALLSMSYIDPNDGANNMRGKGVGFYKLGMEADIELNANIKHLQLGCGGINGAGGCDIDIENLSLSGMSDTREGRAGSSAKLTNPFLEFAVKNPTSASTREVVGLRLSAEKVLGLLTLGDENSDKPNGINSLSGYLKINPTQGMGYTNARSMTYADTGQTIDGKVNARICLICIIAPTLTLDFKSNNYNLALQETTAPIQINGTTVSGTRMSSAQLTGVANINQLNFGGNLTANIQVLGVGLLNLQKEVSGNITGLKANITVDQNLGLIHKIPVNNPFSLSVQNSEIWWPNADVAAQQGWWMAFNDSINIGDVTPEKRIDITNDVLKQVVGPISDYISRNPPSCNALDCLFGDKLGVGNVHLPNTNVNFPLKDLQLKNQSFAPNCYGNLRFC